MTAQEPPNPDRPLHRRLTRRQLVKGTAIAASALPLAGLRLPAAASPVAEAAGTPGLAGAAGAADTAHAAGAAAGSTGRPLAPASLVAPSRADAAFARRIAAARFQRDQRLSAQIANADQQELPPGFATFTKGLPHDRLGLVQPAAYEALLLALRTGRAADFESIPLGGRLKLANPQGALAFNLTGPDPGALACPPPPRFDSAEQAVELAELYWQALARDVPFRDYETDPLIARAAAELDDLRQRAPGAVTLTAAAPGAGRAASTTPRTVFRGPARGCSTGPYISQFLLQDVPFAALGGIAQRIPVAAAEHDSLTAWGDWLAIQNGAPAGATVLDGTPRYLRSGRDLAEYVHRDFSYQSMLNACLILLKMGAPTNAGNPYNRSRTQDGFATFGPPQVLAMLAGASQAALTVCWYQKWMVHRRLRPEEMAGRVETRVKGGGFCPVHPSLLDSVALARTLSAQSTALLTSSYPEGCPAHPAFPAGHAVIAGTGTAVLKAFFDETFVLPRTVDAAADGRKLERWTGAPLTVGGELDKLAANIAMGRNFAGIHWRSDMTSGIELGEEVAISLMREHQLVANEPGAGWTFHRADGRTVSA